MHKNFVHRHRSLILPVILLMLCLVLATVVAWPDPSAHSTYEVTLADNCGRFANLISHTIPDVHTCKIRCQDQCEAKDLRYSDVAFVESEAGCNSCTCTCKKSWW